MRVLRTGDPAKMMDGIRRGPGDEAMREAARIVDDVRARGDEALLEHERRFGGGGKPLKMSAKEVEEAYEYVDRDQVRAVESAQTRLERAEGHFGPDSEYGLDPAAGCRVSKRYEPVESAGCYVPGGLARYPSSAVMSVTAAALAGVDRIAVVSPPGPSGDIDPLTVVAADTCGATEIYRAGGAQAIAALAYGTETIRRVAKVAGPGGRYVAAAKRLVSGDVETDMTAGPTELGIILSSKDDAELAALDLVSQAEHGPGTLCFALTTSESAAKLLRERVESLAGAAERRREVELGLSTSFVAVCRDRGQMVRAANEIAPEHLQIFGEGDWDDVTGPGLILLGGTPSAASDYLLGSNHVLPTSGTARARGPLSPHDFVKQVTRVRAGSEALRRIRKNMETLAGAEGLPGHAAAVRARPR